MRLHFQILLKSPPLNLLVGSATALRTNLQVLLPAFCDNSLKYQVALHIELDLAHMGVRFFSRGETSPIWLSFSDCWRCNANGRSQNALPFLHFEVNAVCYDHGRRDKFFQVRKSWIFPWAGEKNFPEGQKVVKFNFTRSKLRKQLVLLKI